jgi:DNA recombination protein RmuC
MELALAAFISVVIGGALMWLTQRPHVTMLQEHTQRLAADLAQAQEDGRKVAQALAQRDTEMARIQEALTQERRGYEDKLALLQRAEAELKQTFKALSADALRESSESFLQLATTSLREFQTGAVSDLEQRKTAVEQLVTPLRDALDHFDRTVQDIERTREGAYSALNQHLQQVAQTQDQLRQEATKLATALTGTRAQGQWGEMQLRRVVELAGMVDYCDFQEQVAMGGGDRDRLRPDLVVRLPGGRCVVIDAKTPLTAYLAAMGATDDIQRDHYSKESNAQVRAHVRALSAKAYWDLIPNAVEFVIMFLPEPLYITALRVDPALLEDAAQARVVLAGPATLIALLKAIAYGWRQEAVADNARRVSELGRELHQRIAKVSGYFARLGQALAHSVEAYNQAVGSLESRVLVTARRFSELGAGSSEEIEAIAIVDHTPRSLQAPEIAIEPDTVPTDHQALPMTDRLATEPTSIKK